MKLLSIFYIILIFLLCIGTTLYVNYDFVNPSAGKWYLGIYISIIIVIFYLFYKPYNFISLFIHISAFSTFLLALYGLIQLIWVNYASSEKTIIGNFDNPAGYASSLCAGFPMILYFFNRSKRYTYCTVFAGLLIVISTILSDSRAGILSMATMIIIWSLLKAKVNKKMLFLLLLGTMLLISALYLYKKDSADGRILIWQCSWEMIKDKPLLGYGTGGFRANYMNYQAKYFKENPESLYSILADNINKPFNEYILLLVNYGIVGFSIFLVFVYFLWKSYRRNPCLESKIALICLIGIAVFSCFSYPLSYPFTWVMIILSVYTIIKYANYTIFSSHYVRKFIYLSIICTSSIAFFRLSEHILNQFFWTKIAKQSLIRQTNNTFTQYGKLLPKLKNDYLFLYNYAAELNYGGFYHQSQQIAIQCHYLLSDYDLQLLIGDNYLKMKKYKKAEEFFEHAAYMCPNRFIPLSKLMKIYQSKGESSKAIEMAEIILNKSVKIHSETIKQIKEEARNIANSLGI